MMAIIENKNFVDDAWTGLEPDETALERSMIIIPFERLEEVMAQWPHGQRALGIDLPNDISIREIAPYLSRFDIITLNIPGFGDGRAFSQAKSLRSSYGFGGTIRVKGNFLPDQYGFLLQCGVDSFVVSDRFSLEEWLRQADLVPSTYQRNYAAGNDLEVRLFIEAQTWAEQPHFG